MRCQKHPTDLSSSVGVCATCLRERLLALIAAQSQAHHHAQLPRSHSRATVDDSRKSDAQPLPLPSPPLFRCSVSPYVARRKSDDAAWSSQHLRFYSTPQVGPTYNSSTTTTCRYKQGRFSLLSNFFRSRSEKLNPDPGFPSQNSSDASSSSPSWFSTLFSARRNKQSTLCSAEYSGAAGHKPRRRMDRGMSPARCADCDYDFEDGDRSPSGSASSSDSAYWWQRTPVAPATVRHGKSGHGKNVSRLAFCLSPLVRASPNRHWNQKGGLPPDIGLCGEVRVPVKPHLSTAASYCANRSRKLCDLGRVNRNR